MSARASYGLLTAALGTGLLALGLAFSIQMIGAVVGPFDLLAPVAEGGAAELRVWRPASASRDSIFETRRRARAWSTALGGRARVRDVDSLAALAADGRTVVAVGDARRLTAGELAELREFVARGGGAILAGPVAALDPDGAARGGAAMAELLGARVAALPPGAATALVAARRGPLAAALAPGQRLAVRGGEALVAIDDAASELRWADASGGAPAPGARGASLRRELGAGRLVWLGAGPDLSAAGVLTPANELGRLTAAAFAWAAREPFAASAAAGLDARVRRQGPRRHLVDVTNRGVGASAPGASLVVHLNAAAERVAVARTILQQAEPRFRFHPREQEVEIDLPALAAGESLSFTLDLDPPATGAA